MNVPILKQGEVLICSIQSSLSDHELLEMQRRLAREVTVHRSLGVIIDVTALDIVDSFAARTLANLAQTLTLRGAKTIVVGIQPEVAFAMVQLGLRLPGATTALDLEDALQILDDCRIRRRRRDE